MTKILTITINCCRDCPNMYNYDDGESPWESNHCIKVFEKDPIPYTPIHKYINSLDTIPDWCPLEEKTNEN